MRCPKDGAEMLPEVIRGVQLDRCPKCNGLWVDWGELRRVSDNHVTEHELTYRGRSSRNCPTCAKRMNKGDLHSVIVEECGCGIFFDRGELDDILGADILPRITLTRDQIRQLTDEGRLQLRDIEIIIEEH